jgi:hypothetical protein
MLSRVPARETWNEYAVHCDLGMDENVVHDEDGLGFLGRVLK